MSHELAITNGQAHMAYVGEMPWHRLGTPLQAGSDLSTWEAAVFPWTLRSSPVCFAPMGAEQVLNASTLTTQAGKAVQLSKWEDRKVIYRSDTGQPMAVVGDGYNVVQPRDVLAFFRDLIKDQGFEMDTAGALKDGRVYWALARTGQAANVAGDQHLAYTLLATSCDGSMSNTARLTDVRVVCQNTLSYAEQGRNGSVVKSRHSSEFNPDDFKQRLGLVDFEKSWYEQATLMQRLAETPVTPIQAAQFAVEVAQDSKGREAFQAAVQAVEASREIATSAAAGAAYQRDRVASDLAQLKADIAKSMESMKDGGVSQANAIVGDSGRATQKLWNTIHTGKGQQTDAARGTAYGLLNGATRWVDYERKSKDQGTRTASAWFGDGVNRKAKALTLARELAAVA